jgi:polyisoprenyl-phosphate glycosyltransferase
VGPELSIVIPCYNERDCLPELHRRVTSVAKHQCGDRYEIILINDGSKDETWSIMQRLAGEDPHLVCINLSRNHGHQLALTAGLDLAAGRYIMILDADLQDPPELLSNMMDTMHREKADVVYAVRRHRSGETVAKKWTAKIFYRLLKGLTDTDIPLDTGDFRLMSRRALDALQSMPEQSRFIRGMVSWIGFKQVPIGYDRAERVAGETKYPLGKMIKLALDAITGFSTAPLRFATLLGMGLAVVSLLLLFYVLLAWMSGKTVEGWTSLMLVVVILGSAQMFVLGMIGEYLGRVYMEAKKRPTYIVADVVGPAQGRPKLGHYTRDAIATKDSPGGIGTLPTK